MAVLTILTCCSFVAFSAFRGVLCASLVACFGTFVRGTLCELLCVSRAPPAARNREEAKPPPQTSLPKGTLPAATKTRHTRAPTEKTKTLVTYVALILD